MVWYTIPTMCVLSSHQTVLSTQHQHTQCPCWSFILETQIMWSQTTYHVPGYWHRASLHRWYHPSFGIVVFLSFNTVSRSRAFQARLAPRAERLSDTTSETLGLMQRRVEAVACWAFFRQSRGGLRAVSRNASAAGHIFQMEKQAYPIGNSNSTHWSNPCQRPLVFSRMLVRNGDYSRHRASIASGIYQNSERGPNWPILLNVLEKKHGTISWGCSGFTLIKQFFFRGWSVCVPWLGFFVNSVGVFHPGMIRLCHVFK